LTCSCTYLTLDDPELKAELIVEGIDFPTAMSFLGSNDILVLEKEGTTRRITEGKLVVVRNFIIIAQIDFLTMVIHH